MKGIRFWLLLFAVSVLGGASQSVWAIDQNKLLATKPARTLSEYGLFQDAGARNQAEGLVLYELNNPLFTDYALKIRYLYIPKESGPATYQEDGVLEFPVGTVLVKTFAYPASFEQPDADIRYIETRLLIHKRDGWKAYPYVWNEEQTEARLKVAGKRLEIPVVWADGKSDIINYAVPNMNQCKGCHVNADKAFTPIGPKVRNLNRQAKGKSENQLELLRQAGYLKGGPENLEESPRVPEPFNPDDGNLQARARAYLDGNCAHCHSPGHPADTSGLYLNYEENREVHWGVNKPPVAAGRGAGGLLVDIHPGAPEKSILLFRMDSTDPGIMMPELGRSTIDQEGVELIRKFIAEMN
ncbi:SO2930 family diheme c-type cytochrome [Sneathiella limimaris]|uniref:SO2930 family diheme c-type cytochrome n=1 Tax=Sneathiella limimaris TaxID=1964213 RepID=UPI00146D3EFB|nr:SO2930 family diheme c-type cytochrome [Sneathiella limimaris]